MLNKQFYKTKKKNENDFLKNYRIKRDNSLKNIINDPIKYIINRNTYREYGKAVNYCIKHNLDIKNIQNISKNKLAEEVLGIRYDNKRIGFFLYTPAELDYFCPICSKPPTLKTLSESPLDFSEYRGFMFCRECNIDIPSFMCLKIDSKKVVDIYSNRFIEFIDMIQKKELFKKKEYLKNLEDIMDKCIKDIIKKRFFRKKKLLKLYILYRKDIKNFINDLPAIDPEKLQER